MTGICRDPFPSRGDNKPYIPIYLGFTTVERASIALLRDMVFYFCYTNKLPCDTIFGVLQNSIVYIPVSLLRLGPESRRPGEQQRYIDGLKEPVLSHFPILVVALAILTCDSQKLIM